MYLSPVAAQAFYEELEKIAAHPALEGVELVARGKSPEMLRKLQQSAWQRWQEQARQRVRAKARQLSAGLPQNRVQAMRKKLPPEQFEEWFSKMKTAPY